MGLSTSTAVEDKKEPGARLQGRIQGEFRILLLGTPGSGRTAIANMLLRAAVSPTSLLRITLVHGVQTVLNSPMCPSMEGLEDAAETLLQARVWAEGFAEHDFPTLLPALHRLLPPISSFLSSSPAASSLPPHVGHLPYFEGRLEAVGGPGFKPSPEDMAHVVDISWVEEVSFKRRGVLLRVFNVEGAGAVRKWVHMFEGVDAVMFVTALDGYLEAVPFHRLPLYRLKATSSPSLSLSFASLSPLASPPPSHPPAYALPEAAALFRDITELWFSGRPVLVVLNKLDAFLETFDPVAFEERFPAFREGSKGESSDAALRYITDTLFRRSDTGTTYFQFASAIQDARLKEVLYGTVLTIMSLSKRQ